MKYLYIFLVFFSMGMFSQEAANEIHQMYKQGKVLDIHKYFAEKLTVKVNEQEDFLSKTQAEAVFKNFFEKNTFSSFQNSRVSGKPEQFQYIAGTLNTQKGQFRVSMLIKKGLIHQYRIESHE